MQGKLQDNSIIICGYLGKDAEYKTVGDNNSSLTKFGVKVGERKVEGQDKSQAIWVNCDCWHSVARATKDLKKFDVVLCVGKIKVSEYEKDGEKKQSKALVCEGVFTMSKALENVSEQANAGTADIPREFEEILKDDGDVPF